jgi:hypothetical protein
MAKRKNPPRLDPEHAQTLRDKIEWEGDLLYVVENWNFSEFHDKKFNSVRKALVEAARKFRDYTGVEEAPDEESLEKGNNICDQCGDTLDEFGSCNTCDSQVD